MSQLLPSTSKASVTSGTVWLRKWRNALTWLAMERALSKITALMACSRVDLPLVAPDEDVDVAADGLDAHGADELLEVGQLDRTDFHDRAPWRRCST